MRTCRLIVLMATLALLSCPAAAQSGSQTPQAVEQLEQVFDDPLFSKWQKRQERREAAIPDGLLPDLGVDPGAIQDSIGEVFRRLMRSLFPRGQRQVSCAAPSSGGGSGMSEALHGAAIIIGVILIIVLAVFLVAAFRTHIRVRQSGPTTKIEEALEEGDALAATSETWLEHAESLASQEDLRLAFRAMYLALLSGLHRGGAINFNKRRTNWTYVRHFAGTATNRRQLEQLTDNFDAYWYGSRRLDRSGFERMRSLTNALLGDQKP